MRVEQSGRTDADAYCYTDAYGHIYTDADAYTDAYAYAYTYTYTVVRQYGTGRYVAVDQFAEQSRRDYGVYC